MCVYLCCVFLQGCGNFGSSQTVYCLRFAWSCSLVCRSTRPDDLVSLFTSCLISFLSTLTRYSGSLFSFFLFWHCSYKCICSALSHLFVVLIVECMLPMALPNFVVVGDCQSFEVSHIADPARTGVLQKS